MNEMERLEAQREKNERRIRHKLEIFGVVVVVAVTATLCGHNAAFGQDDSRAMQPTYESMYQHSVAHYHAWDNDRYSDAFYRVEDHSYDFERDTDDGSLNMPATLRGTAMLRAAQAECTGTLYEDFSCEASTDAPDFDPGDTVATECWDTPSANRSATLACNRAGYETEYTATGHDADRPV